MNRSTSRIFKHLPWVTSLLPPYTSLLQFRRRTERLKPNVARMPIPATRLASLKRDDQFLISYPRSGSTWTRHLLRDVIAMERPECTYPEKLSDLLPAIHPRDQPMDTPLGRQFQMPSRIFKSHNIEDVGTYRFVYLIRNPADALVSYYHFHRLVNHRCEEVAAGIDIFCEAMVNGWIHHVELALEQQQNRSDEVLMVSYEGLCADPVFQLRRITDFLGLKARGETLSSAVERNAFARLRSQEEARRGASEEYFFRKGRSGTAKEELAPETFEMISAKALGIYERAISTIMTSQINPNSEVGLRKEANKPQRL